MSVIRAFIAVNISPEIKQRLTLISEDLQRALRGVPVRWVPVENIHLTLKFLGDVSETNLDLLMKLLKAEAGSHPVFELSAGELGAFPSIRRPRVIWVNIQAPAELATLQRGIDNETARLGYAREQRPFSPHLTLGRVSRNANANDLRRISEELATFKVGYIGAANVHQVHLYRSDLKPSGAVYTLLYSANLDASADNR
jgi:RNA 2',3'-cyclic 3'-phosphodiesterase